MESGMSGYVIDYFELPSRSNAKSRGFFSAAFGWSFVGFGPDYDEIHEAKLLGGINGDADDRSAAPVIGIRTTDIAKAERDVVAAGGVLTRSPYDYPGGRRFFFREPGGAELMVYSPKG
jgi:uncharacterized protein